MERLMMKRAETIFIDNQIKTGIGAEFNGIGGKDNDYKRKRTYSTHPRQ
jgi:hypothetical protein